MEKDQEGSYEFQTFTQPVYIFFSVLSDRSDKNGTNGIV